MTTLTLPELEGKWADLETMNTKLYSKEIEEKIQFIIDHLPPLSEDPTKADDTARVLEISCNTRMLRPAVCKEAEEDINKILRMNKGSAETWVSLSECLLRRNACKEASEALNNALRLEPKSIPALCKYSQVLRCRCASKEKLPLDEKKKLLDDAIKMSKSAVELDVQNGEAWNSLSLSLLSRVTLEGASKEDLRRAFSAIQQSVRLCPDDPDVHFNKGMMESLLGRFDTAAVELIRAHELDRNGLKVAKAAYEENVGILRRICSTIENTKGVGKKDFIKCVKELEFFSKKYGNQNGTIGHFSVLNVVSAPTMQPVVLLTLDVHNRFVLLLIYQVRSGAFRIGETVSVPITDLEVENSKPLMSQRVEPYPPFDQTEPVEVNLPRFFVDCPHLLQINGREVPEGFRASLQVSAKLFA